jgi:hypothetical protein
MMPWDIDLLSPPEIDIESLIVWKDSLEEGELKTAAERVISIYLERRQNPIQIEDPD